MNLIILGAGGYGQTVADIAAQLGYEPAFLDDNSPLAIGKTDDYVKHLDCAIIPAFGSSELRLLWCHRIKKEGGHLATLIHPTAYVSPTAQIGEGVVILPHAVVNTNVCAKTGCIVNIGALVDHGTVLEEGVHIAPGAIVKAENRIPSLTKVESGTVIQNRTYPL